MVIIGQQNVQEKFIITRVYVHGKCRTGKSSMQLIAEWKGSASFYDLPPQEFKGMLSLIGRYMAVHKTQMWDFWNQS
jgi:hypothetical protein